MSLQRDRDNGSDHWSFAEFQIIFPSFSFAGQARTFFCASFAIASNYLEDLHDARFHKRDFIPIILVGARSLFLRQPESMYGSALVSFAEPSRTYCKELG